MDESSSDITNQITDFNRPFLVEWLKDRSAFHQWFSSIVTGTFVVVTVFGEKPGFDNPAGIFLSIAVLMFLFALICNLVCVWSIPTWKYRVSAQILMESSSMKRELSITAWLGVISFVSGLTFAVVGNSAT